MQILDGMAGERGRQRSSDRPVMVDGWAESVIDLERWQSRRRHPSNREPAWEKDGGYEMVEWAT